MPKKKSNKTVRVVRWIARVSSGIVATLILLTFAGGEFIFCWTGYVIS